MPRRRRGLKDRCIYHITHRCHKREFLFKFAQDRQVYVDLLRETVKRYRLDVLNYVITSNHVHLLVWVRYGEMLPRAMQYLQGEFAQYYNKRKTREGAFWRDRYHTTLIQDGSHLSRCLFYIDMNMVRAGVVDHPEQWHHGGFQELSGNRQRYRVINQTRLLRCLGNGNEPDTFRSWYLNTLEACLATTYHVREPYWSKAFAVGDVDWLSAIYQEFGFKRKQIRAGHCADGVAEEGAPYYIEG
jgi:putative transposase